MESESLFTFVAIIIIVMGIAQIILFFKIWGMTNDVKEIKQTFGFDKELRDAELAAFSGNKELAKRILDNYLKAGSASLTKASLKDLIDEEYKYLGLEKPAK